MIEGGYGTDRLSAAPGVVDWSVRPAGFRVGAPTDNNAYVGHLMVTDPGGQARVRAEELLGGLTVACADLPAGAAR